MPGVDDVRAALDAVVAEMRAAGMWQREPLPEAASRFREAFAADTMSFDQWLQFVFVPQVEKLIAAGGPFPRASAVAVRAARELDGAGLVALEGALRAFDALFNE